MGIFLRIQNNLKLSFCIMLVMKHKMFFGVSSVVSEKALTNIRHGYTYIFFFGGGGLLLCRDFWGFVRNPIGFFRGGGGLIFVRIRASPSLEIRSTPSPENWVPQKELLHSK